jgi:hypothetical protein
MTDISAVGDEGAVGAEVLSEMRVLSMRMRAVVEMRMSAR